FRLQVAGENLTRKKKELAGEVERIDFNAVALKERAEIQQETVALSRDNYKDARAQYRAGTITLTRLGDFNLAYAEARFLLLRVYFLQQELNSDVLALLEMPTSVP
ncbi:MAG: TolC family protein, partial [Deltaproteobacteria bacterium]|nr:TolC family protein [Deltaproteobacteria bacterium]